MIRGDEISPELSSETTSDPEDTTNVWFDKVLYFITLYVCDADLPHSDENQAACCRNVASYLPKMHSYRIKKF